MITISHQQVTPEIIALFDLTKPTMPRAFNVLEGINHGQILVADPTQPRWAIVREAIYGTLYIGGQMSASLLASIVEYFRKSGEVGIGCWLDNPLNEKLPPNPNYDGRTLYFTERSARNDLQKIQLPAEYSLVPRDEHLFSMSFDYEATLASFGSVENVLQHTLGFVILRDDAVVCEAATGAPTHGLIEIGVTTAETYRQHGFAAIACARLIELCEDQGYRTWWDCAKQNIPSTKLARKLGYQNEREYRYVWWAPNSS
jgi:RimJ/RimL family protein N-acetyltransferase